MKKYIISRKLIISNGKSTIDILIEIIFFVFPLKLLFSCYNYNLIFSDNSYKLDAFHLLKGETIFFSLKNSYSNIPIFPKVRFDSLKNNTFEQPIVNFSNLNDFSIILPDNKELEIEKLECILEIYATEEIKFQIYFNAIIFPTYFDFYLFNFETKRYETNKIEMYIPTFKKQYELTLNFLISTFINKEVIGELIILSKDNGINFIGDFPKKITIDSNKTTFSISISINLDKLFDEEIAKFEFKIFNFSKTIELIKKSECFQDVNINLIKKLSLKGEKTPLENKMNIMKDSILVSPFSCWGKGKFLYRKINQTENDLDSSKEDKDYILEIPNNAELYYLTNEG